jgi:hypothetical protein
MFDTGSTSDTIHQLKNIIVCLALQVQHVLGTMLPPFDIYS